MTEASLDKLLEMPGVIAAGEFARDGSVVAFKTALGLPEPARKLATGLSAKLNETFEQLAGTYSSMTEMNWLPRRFWCYSGGDWTVAVGVDKLVFVQTESVDLSMLFEALTS